MMGHATDRRVVASPFIYRTCTMTYIIHSYVVCRLSALTDDIRVCPTEIEDARWVPFAQFQQEASHPVRRPIFFLLTISVLDSARPNPLDPTRPDPSSTHLSDPQDRRAAHGRAGPLPGRGGGRGGRPRGHRRDGAPQHPPEPAQLQAVPHRAAHAGVEQQLMIRGWEEGVGVVHRGAG